MGWPSFSKWAGVCFKLTADLDMKMYAARAAADPSFAPSYDQEKGWKPIPLFRGNFNGNGHAIQNLYINRPDEDYVGFFGEVKGEAEMPDPVAVTGFRMGVIQYLGIENADVTGNKNTGALVGGSTYMQIDHCYSTGKVMGGAPYQTTTWEEDQITSISHPRGAGGLVGQLLGGTIAACYSMADVTGIHSVGGLVGFFWGRAENCYATGDVFGKYAHGIGGVIGMDHSYISQISCCYSTSKVEAGPLFNHYSTTWVGTGGVVGEGSGGGQVGGFMRNLYALNSIVRNGIVSDLTPISPGSPHHTSAAVVGAGVTRLVTGGLSWNGLDLNNQGSGWGGYPASQFLEPATWNEFDDSLPDGEWTLSKSKLPILENTGGPQKETLPDWFTDKPSDIETKEPAFDGVTKIYTITSAAELAWCSEHPEQLSGTTLFFKAKEIDLSGYSKGAGWQPIGYRTAIDNLFVVGNGCTITGLTMDYFNRNSDSLGITIDRNFDKDAIGVGLFGKLKNSTITGLHLRDVKISDYRPTGAGMLLGCGRNISVTSCSAEGEIKVSGGHVGGLIGIILDECDIYDVSVKGRVEVSVSGFVKAGGILGYRYSFTLLNFQLSKAFSDVDITTVERSTTLSQTVGGLVGALTLPNPSDMVNTVLSDCYSLGNISFSGNSLNTKTGGLIGEIEAGTTTYKAYRIANCYVAGSLEGGITGGLIGEIHVYNTINDDKTSQIQLDNVVIFPQKVEGQEKVGYVCGNISSKNNKGEDSFHFNSVKKGSSPKFNQNLVRWDSIQYRLNGKPISVSEMADAAYKDEFQKSASAEKLCLTHWNTDDTWKKSPWGLANASLPTLKLSEGNLFQSGIPPLYLRLKAGLVEDTVELSSREDLDLLSQFVNGGGNTKGMNVLLTRSIDMGDALFTPIGTAEHPFNGSFNGQGYSIRGLKVEVTGPAGLIGVAGPDSNLQDLALIDPEIQGGDDVGALVGATSGSVKRCYAAAGGVYPWSSPGDTIQVRGGSNVGGLIGRLSGPGSSSVSDCYTAVNVMAKKDNAGGLVGRVDATDSGKTKALNRCYTVGRVSAKGYRAGGIYGASYAGTRLQLQIMLVLSPSVMDSTGGKNCAIGGDTTAALYDKNYNQLFVWDGLDATWNDTSSGEDTKPLTIMNMHADDKLTNLCKAEAWHESMRFDAGNDGIAAWLIKDGASWALKGFEDEQFNFVEDGRKAGKPDLNKDEDGYYLIQSATDWEAMGNLVNESPQTYAGAKYRLTADISFSDSPVYMGGYVPVGQVVPFTGELDGNGHIITFDPLYFASGDIGLFGTLGEGANIHDLTVNAAVENTRGDTRSTAAVAAQTEKGSTLQNIMVTGSVADTAGELSNNLYRYVGGLVGLAQGVIRSCTNQAAVSGGQYTGGVAGSVLSGAVIEDCRNRGSVTGDFNAGGIASFMGSGTSLRRCSNTGYIAGGNKAGGIAGFLQNVEDVAELSNTGTIRITSDSTSASGSNSTAGFLENAKLENVYSTGNITGTAVYAGGLAGRLFNGSVLANGYATGSVKGDLYTGGVVGGTRNSTLRQTAALNLSIDNGGRIAEKVESSELTDNFGLNDLKSKISGEAGQDVTRETLHTREFWETTLGLSAELWEIPAAGTPASDFFLPVLKNLGEKASSMPLHLQDFARTNATLTLTTDNTEIWSPKGQDEPVVITAKIDGTTQTAVEWNCSDTSLTAADGTDENGSPTYSLTIPVGYSGTFTVSAKLKNNTAITSNDISITIKARTDAQAPELETQPQDIETVVGKPATLSVAARSKDGGKLSYQWYKAGSSGKNGTAIDGAIDAAYKAPAEAAGNISYYCVVTNTIEDGEGVGNTAVSVQSSTAQVTVKKDSQDALTIVGHHRTVTYGDGDFTLQTSGGSGNGQVTWQSDNEAVVSVDQGGKVTIHKAGEANITAIKAGDDHYLPSPATIIVTVNKAELTVTAVNTDREYGQPNPDLTYTITGFAKSENDSVLTKKPTASCSAGLNAAVGTYPITVSGGEAENYEFVYFSGTLTVTKTGQSDLSILQGSQINKTYGDGAITLSVTGGSGNGKVIWQSSDEAVASVDQNGKVTIHKAGEAKITATKAGEALTWRQTHPRLLW